MYEDIYTNLFMLLYEWNKLIKNLNVFNYSPILLLHLANEILDLNLIFLKRLNERFKTNDQLERYTIELTILF